MTSYFASEMQRAIALVEAQRHALSASWAHCSWSY